MTFFDTLRDTPRSTAQFGRRAFGGLLAVARNVATGLGASESSLFVRMLDRFRASVTADLQKNSLRTAQALKTAQAAQATATKALQSSAQSRVTTTLQSRGFGIKRTGAELGVLEMGRSGFQLNGGYLRNAGGKAMTAGIGLHIVGGLFQQGATIGDSVGEALRKGAKPSEIRGIMAARAVGSVVKTVGSLSGVETFATGLMRLGGLSERDSQKEVDKFYTAVSTTREEKERRQAEHRASLASALAEVQAVLTSDVKRLNEFVPKSFRVRDRFDRLRYREQLNAANGLTLGVKRAILENQARDRARNGD